MVPQGHPTDALDRLLRCEDPIGCALQAPGYKNAVPRGKRYGEEGGAGNWMLVLQKGVLSSSRKQRWRRGALRLKRRSDGRELIESLLLIPFRGVWTFEGMSSGSWIGWDKRRCQRMGGCVSAWIGLRPTQ